MFSSILIFLIILIDITCKGISNDKIYFTDVYIDIGDNIGNHVANQIRNHLKNIEYIQLHEFSEWIEQGHGKSKEEIENEISLDNNMNNNYDQLKNSTLLLSIGNTLLTSDYLSLSNMKPESFRIISNVYDNNKIGLSVIVTNGLPLDSHRHQNISFDRYDVHYGAIVGAYATLELLGFVFGHPLDPYRPSTLGIWTDRCTTNSNPFVRCNIDILESPYWPERSFHIHTQHPLEVTEVLQGHDIPQFGIQGEHCGLYSDREYQKNKGPRSDLLVIEDINSDKNKRHPGPYCERWEDMVKDVNSLFEWAVANRQNKVEWLLLGNYKWGDELETRLKRLRVLTSLGHKYSLLIGADCPIGNIQQHAWHMVNTRLPIAQQKRQIRKRIDWIFNANFDFLSTESGLSEFTHPECDLMLELIDEFANYVNGTWGREAAIKVHCSTGQQCKDFPDPRTGEPINFNFLPTYATPALGVFPHTVQVYALDDPTAGAYGNKNFSYIEDYMVMEAKRGNRSVMFYGETAYWVNVDVDVPLFLPIYGQRRLHDLRRIAGREIAEEFRIDGQMNFDSGWEWGYWLSDLVTARAVWNPQLSPHFSTEDYKERDDEWEAFRESIDPVMRVFGSKYRQRIADLLVNWTSSQADILINGIVEGRPCPNIMKLSGIAYISGDDTWVDLPRKFGMHFLQPDKVHFKEVSDKDWPNALLLLHEMERVFIPLADEMRSILMEAESDLIEKDSLKSQMLALQQADECAESGMLKIKNFFSPSCSNKSKMRQANDVLKLQNKLLSSINSKAVELLQEFDDCMRIFVMRITHVRMLYESRSVTINLESRVDLLNRSRSTISAASKIVAQREIAYRVPWQRIGSWRENPTVYRYGYLWSAHSLYYWWRDQGLAEEGSYQSELSPCYLNRMDATEIALGWGKFALELIRNLINRYSPYNVEFINCIAPPSHEYIFPKDLYHL